MSRTALLVTVTFTLFAMVNSGFVPYAIYNEYKFLCESVCSEYLKGETFSCWMASGFGLGGGEMVIRILPNFDWRYYGIRGRNQISEEFCKSVLVADQFYSSGNKTYCNSRPPKQGNMHYSAKGFRFSDDERIMGDSNVEESFSFEDEITKLAKGIRKEAMMRHEKPDSKDDADASNNETNESSDEPAKRFFPMVGSSANIMEVGNAFDVANQNKYPHMNLMQVEQTAPALIGGLNELLENEKYTDFSYPKGQGSYYKDMDDRVSGITQTLPYKRSILSVRRSESTGKISNKLSNAITNALCLWASEDMCENREMVTCLRDACCLTVLKSDMCNLIRRDKSINKHRQNVYQIIQATKYQ